MSGKRDNRTKLQWSLVRFDALEPMVKVLEFGAQKYGPNDWEKGGELFSEDKLLDSILRHVTHLGKKDKESKLSHAAHAMANLMIYVSLHELNKRSKRRKND